MLLSRSIILAESSSCCLMHKFDELDCFIFASIYLYKLNYLDGKNLEVEELYRMLSLRKMPTPINVEIGKKGKKIKSRMVIFRGKKF